MNSDFSDIDRAVVYLSSGLASSFPDAEMEVYLFRGPHMAPRRATASTSQLRPVLEQFCRTFHGASVCLTPNRAYGLVAKMESHPEFVPGGKKPKHPEEEPRIVVVLRRNASQEVLLGTRNKPPKQSFRPVQA